MSKSKRSYKKKYDQWCSRKQVDYIRSSTKQITKVVRLYRLRDEIKMYRYVKPSLHNISDTLNMFDYHSKENGYKIDFLQKVKKTLRSVVEKDILFGFNDKMYLYHTYKILGFIQESVLTHEYSNDPEFLKGTIGADDLNKQYYLDEYKTQKNLVLQDTNIHKGSNLFSSIIYRNFYLRPHLLKQFFAYFALFGVENIKMLEDNTYENRLLKKACKVYMSGRASKDDCADSLLSVLYSYMLFHMQMSKRLALDVAKNLVYDVFNIYKHYTGSEILKNLHVKEVIGSHIVYGFSTKTQFLKDSHKDYIENTIITNMDAVNLDKDIFPTHMIKESVNNPLKVYMLLTPSELLQEIC